MCSPLSVRYSAIEMTAVIIILSSLRTHYDARDCTRGLYEQRESVDQHCQLTLGEKKTTKQLHLLHREIEPASVLRPVIHVRARTLYAASTVLISTQTFRRALTASEDTAARKYRSYM